MRSSPASAEPIETSAENLLNFAIDRQDLKIILDSLPQNATIDRGRIEYEIQILKILTVGWALSFFLKSKTVKTKLMESYWMKVRAFSQSLSGALTASLNRDFDYFAILKERLDIYVGALDRHGEKQDPAVVIGPMFAHICQDEDNPFVVLAGSKMFNHALSSTKEYLETAESSSAARTPSTSR
jgi:hypothetical protein